MFNKIKAVKDLRDQAKTMQKALAEVIEVGSAAGGKVQVAIDGNQSVLRVEIDDEMLTKKDKLQDAIKDASNEAMKKIQKKMAAKMKEMGGLDALKNFGL